MTDSQSMPHATLCANCKMPISQAGIAYLNEWRHKHSGSTRCDAPSVAIPLLEDES